MPLDVERLSVPLEEIDEQRALGWPDFHPEDFCHRCGHRNVHAWHVDNETWNAVMRDQGSLGEGWPWQEIICPQCFTELAREVFANAVWHIRMTNVSAGAVKKDCVCGTPAHAEQCPCEPGCLYGVVRVDFQVDGAGHGFASAKRRAHRQPPQADDRCLYDWRVNDGHGRTLSNLEENPLIHRHGDGPQALVTAILVAALGPWDE